MDNIKHEIEELEKCFFNLYSIIHPGETKPKPKTTKLKLSEDDWIYSEYFEEANKIKTINNGYVTFYFREKNGINSGMLDYIQNERPGYNNHRMATNAEIISKLLSEIKKLKIDTLKK